MSIVKSSNQIEAQAEPLAAVAVRASQDAKPLEPTNDMFSHNTLAGQLPVSLLLCRRERMMLALLVRGATVTMIFVDSFVAAVGGAAGFFLQRQAASLEERKVVCFTFGKSRGQQTLSAGLHYELRFAGVALFLATVVFFLFF